MADTQGYENVILPNAFASPGEAIQARINNQNALTSRYGEAIERGNEMDLRQRELEQKRLEQYGLANLRNLNENTDAQKLLLGDKYANDVTQQELKGVYDDLIAKVGTTDPVTFDYLLHSKTNDFNNWHSQFQQDFDASKAKVDDILKNNTNLDPTQAKDIARSQLDEKYFKLDEQGNITRKPPEEVDTRIDPVAILNDPRMQGQIAIGGQDVLKKYIQSQKLQQEDYAKYSGNKGFINSEDYNIGVSGLQELTHNEHGEPVLKLKTEDLNIGNGTTLKMLPKATYDEMMGVPEVAAAINKMWNPVAAKIEKGFAQQGNAIDPQSEEMLKRDFIRKQIQDNNLDLSFIQKKEKNIIPKPPSITLNVGNASDINDVYRAIDQRVNRDLSNGANNTLMNSLNTDAQNIIMDFARKTSGDNGLTYKNVFLHKNEDGEIGVYKTTSNQKYGKLNVTSLDKLIGYLPRVGTNLKAQPGVGEKRAVIQQGNETTAPPPKRTPTYQGLDADGNPIFK